MPCLGGMGEETGKLLPLTDVLADAALDTLRDGAFRPRRSTQDSLAASVCNALPTHAHTPCRTTRAGFSKLL